MANPQTNVGRSEIDNQRLAALAAAVDLLEDQHIVTAQEAAATDRAERLAALHNALTLVPDEAISTPAPGNVSTRVGRGALVLLPLATGGLLVETGTAAAVVPTDGGMPVASAPQVVEQGTHVEKITLQEGKDDWTVAQELVDQWKVHRSVPAEDLAIEDENHQTPDSARDEQVGDVLDVRVDNGSSHKEHKADRIHVESISTHALPGGSIDGFLGDEGLAEDTHNTKVVAEASDIPLKDEDNIAVGQLLVLPGSLMREGSQHSTGAHRHTTHRIVKHPDSGGSSTKTSHHTAVSHPSAASQAHRSAEAATGGTTITPAPHEHNRFHHQHSHKNVSGEATLEQIIAADSTEEAAHDAEGAAEPEAVNQFGYTGVWQFSPKYWYGEGGWADRALGNPNASITDVDNQVMVAVYLWQHNLDNLGSADAAGAAWLKGYGTGEEIAGHDEAAFLEAEGSTDGNDYSVLNYMKVIERVAPTMTPEKIARELPFLQGVIDRHPELQAALDTDHRIYAHLRLMQLHPSQADGQSGEQSTPHHPNPDRSAETHRIGDGPISSDESVGQAVADKQLAVARQWQEHDYNSPTGQSGPKMFDVKSGEMVGAWCRKENAWIYSKVGVQQPEDSVALVQVKAFWEDGQKGVDGWSASTVDSGAQPQLGDSVVHQYDSDNPNHINIVTAIKGDMMQLTGGDQINPRIGHWDTIDDSAVTSYWVQIPSPDSPSDSILGYLTPPTTTTPQASSTNTPPISAVPHLQPLPRL